MNANKNVMILAGQIGVGKTRLISAFAESRGGVAIATGPRLPDGFFDADVLVIDEAPALTPEGLIAVVETARQLDKKLILVCQHPSQINHPALSGLLVGVLPSTSPAAERRFDALISDFLN